MSDIARYRKALAEIRILAADMFTDHTRKIEAIADAALAGDKPIPDNRPKLTARQAEFLDAIRRYFAEHGYSPSFRELQVMFDFAGPSSPVCHAKALAKKGYLRWSPETARSIVLLEAS